MTTQVGQVSGRASLSKHGKRIVALSMYAKGKAFIGAAILLHRQPQTEHTEYVVLHLMCQGIEVTLKGLLLLRDYDRFIGRLRKPLGHDLLRAADEALLAYGFNPLRAALKQELRELSQLYSRHLLRYANGYDLLVAPRTINRERVLRRVGATLRLTERELRREQRRDQEQSEAQSPP